MCGFLVFRLSPLLSPLSPIPGNRHASREFRDLPCEFSRGPVDGAVGILDHDVVFWLGDLNYRVSEVVNLDEVFRRCDTQEGRDFLQAHDQLNLEVRPSWKPCIDIDRGTRQSQIATPYSPPYRHKLLKVMTSGRDISVQNEKLYDVCIYFLFVF